MKNIYCNKIAINIYIKDLPKTATLFNLYNLIFTAVIVLNNLINM